MTFYTTPRSVVTQIFKLGKEDSPGVGGSPTIRLTTLNAQLGPVASGAFAVFRPSGGKYAGQIVPGDTYSEGPLNDTIDFNTVPFIAGANVGVPTANGTPTGGHGYKFTPTPFAQDDCLTYVVEEGVAGAVYKFTNVAVPDMNFHLMRTGTVTMGGRLLGRKMGPQVAFSGGTTSYQGRAVPPISVGMYSAANWDGLSAGSRLVPPSVDFVFRHNGVFAPWFALDDSVISFEGLLDGAIDAGIQVTVPANVSGTDLEGIFTLNAMEVGTPLFLKLVALGPDLDPTNMASDPYRFQIKMRAVISAPPRRGAQGNLRTWQFDALLLPYEITPFVPFEIEVDCTVDPGDLIP